MRKQERGWNLLELMVVVCMMGVVTTTLLAMFGTVHQEERYSAACAKDLSDLRRAVTRIEDDLRGAKSIAGLDVRLDGTDLMADDRRIAQNIAIFEVKPEGRLAHVRIGLGPRSDAPHRREAVMDFRIRLRGREE